MRSRRIASSRLTAALSTAISSGALTAHAAAPPNLEEIIVTATKRAISIEDIPSNISAVSADQIRDANATSVEELARLVPGLSLPTTGQRTQVNNGFMMRGLNANPPVSNSWQQNMTDSVVSTYLNEIPLFANLRLTDIDRVEVLRGPQGTLYGSGSLGGTVRFVFKEPSLQDAVFDVSARLGGNSHSQEMNHEADIIANIPISDAVAVRLVGGYQTLGGVTDANGRWALNADGSARLADPSDPDSGAVIEPKHDTDELETMYGRAALLWQINDRAKAVLTYFHQNTRGDGDTISGITDNRLAGPDWEHSQRLLTEGAEYDSDLLSLEATVDFGFASLTSATGYTRRDENVLIDVSGLYQSFEDCCGLYFGYPRLLGVSYIDSGSDVLTQELRLVSQTGGGWDWLVGLFYRDQEQTLRIADTLPGFTTWAQNPDTAAALALGDTPYNIMSATAMPGDVAFTSDRDLGFEEIALFGELTRHLTDRWQITAGIRAFRQNFSTDLISALPFCGQACAIVPGDRSGVAVDLQSESDITDQIYRFNTAYDLSDDNLIYFTWAEGFRHGGTNAFPVAGPAAVDPRFATYQADRATNWEIGLKGNILDRRIAYSTAVFRIDWEDPQLDVFAGPIGLQGIINAEEARSQGIEVSLNARATEKLSLALGYTYADAQYTATVPTLAQQSGVGVIVKGDPMPGVPEHMATWSADFNQPLNGGAELRFNVNGSYRSSAANYPNAGFGNFVILPGYDLWNASLAWSRNRLRVGVFGSNLTDEEAMSGVLLRRATFDDRAWVGRPRSYGLFMNYSFF